MMTALIVRRLKPGTFDRFRKEWEPLTWPKGLTKIWLARSDDDPDVVATWALLNLDPEGVDANRDDPAWIRHEVFRLERLDEFQEELMLAGFFHVVEEIEPHAIPRANAPGAAAPSESG